MLRFAAAATAAVCLLLVPPARATTEAPLTFDEVLQLARERAPGILAARAAIDEARGRLTGASVLLRENPRLETSAGRGTSPGGGFTQAEVELSQDFELGGSRGARIEGAEAGLARAEASSEDSTRRVLLEVAVSFFRAIAAEEQVRLARESESVAAEITRIAERRFQNGDIPRLDVDLSKAASSRARSDLRAAEAHHLAAVGQLRLLLGLDPDQPLAIRGSLRDRPRHELSALAARIGERPDLRALAAERREADAEGRLGSALAWPELGVGLKYEREEEADVLLGTLSLSLPIFERGQGIRAEAAARSQRLRLEWEAGSRTARTQLRTSFDVYERRLLAVDELEGSAIPLLDSNEALSTRSYESGQLALPDLLVIRREALGTRREHLERQLEAAIAALELEAAAGVLR